MIYFYIYYLWVYYGPGAKTRYLTYISGYHYNIPVKHPPLTSFKEGQGQVLRALSLKTWRVKYLSDHTAKKWQDEIHLPDSKTHVLSTMTKAPSLSRHHLLSLSYFNTRMQTRLNQSYHTLSEKSSAEIRDDHK